MRVLPSWAPGRGLGFLGRERPVSNPLPWEIVAALGGRYWDARFGVTVATGVSSWVDMIQGTALSQGTGAAQPSIANGVITFDGTDDFLQGTFTFNPPQGVVLCGQQVSWTASDLVFDGVNDITMGIQQKPAGDGGVTPEIVMRTAAINGGTNTEWAVGTDAILSSVFVNSGCFTKVNLNANVTVAGNASDAGGFTLGTRGGAGGQFANISVRAVAILTAVPTTAQLEQLIRSMAAQYGIAV